MPKKAVALAVFRWSESPEPLITQATDSVSISIVLGAAFGFGGSAVLQRTKGQARILILKLLPWHTEQPNTEEILPEAMV